MDRLQIDLGNTAATVSLDSPVSLQKRIWGVIGVRLVDELTGSPPRGAIRLICPTPGLAPRVAQDGLVGLTGIPTKVFPGLKTTPYDVELTILADGYLEVVRRLTVASSPAFPDDFTPLLLPDLALHRVPVVIQGRTVRAVAGSVQVVPAAHVRISGLWRTAPPANLTVPPEAPNVIHLDEPLSADRAQAASAVAGSALTAAGGNDKALVSSEAAGAKTLSVSNRQGLAAGGILVIDPERPGLREYAVIQVVRGGSTADQIAQVDLEWSTSFPHRRGAIARPVTPSGPSGPSNPFAQDAVRGDTTLFLSALNGLATAHQVRVGGGAADELHDLQLYETSSDASGYFRLPPVSRVAQIELEASDGTLTVKKVVSPDYDHATNVVDLVF